MLLSRGGGPRGRHGPAPSGRRRSRRPPPGRRSARCTGTLSFRVRVGRHPRAARRGFRQRRFDWSLSLCGRSGLGEPRRDRRASGTRRPRFRHGLRSSGCLWAGRRCFRRRSALCLGICSGGRCGGGRVAGRPPRAPVPAQPLLVAVLSDLLEPVVVALRAADRGSPSRSTALLLDTKSRLLGIESACRC